jgi:hypothetical protein
LEDRLNSFREELLDKELVLGEISALSDRLAEAAAGGLGGLSDAVNAASRGIIEADGVGAQAPDVAAAAAGGDAPGLATAKALNDVQVLHTRSSFSVTEYVSSRLGCERLPGD